MADGLEHLLHRRALADDAEIEILLLQQRLVRHHLLHGSCRVKGLIHHLLKLGHIKRLENIIVGAVLHRLNGRLGSPEGGHQNHRRFGVKFPQPLQCFDAGDAAHAHIHDHQIRLELRNQFQRHLAAAGGVQFQPVLTAEDPFKRVADIRLVINKQQFIHPCAGSVPNGRSKVSLFLSPHKRLLASAERFGQLLIPHGIQQLP